jgi:hypothetical protein
MKDKRKHVSDNGWRKSSIIRARMNVWADRSSTMKVRT